MQVIQVLDKFNAGWNSYKGKRDVRNFMTPIFPQVQKIIHSFWHSKTTYVCTPPTPNNFLHFMYLIMTHYNQ